MRVKPAPGLSVRDPVTKQLLPADGIDVSDGDIFWTRCLNDKDVVLGSAEDSASAASNTVAGSNE
jgi:Protein of unknown function (DUF2635)